MTPSRLYSAPAARSARTSATRPLLLALATLGLAAAALPASAATTWWTAQPHMTIGTATINVHTKGALGNGVHNDTAAIQAAIDALPTSGGTVFVPAGRYMIDATKSLRMRSHTRLLMDPNAELDVIPNNQGRYYAIKVWNVSNVRIVGGRMVGDRTKHKGTGGEWGYGINIEGSTNVIVKSVKLSNFWGDGIWVGATGWGRSVRPSDYVTINGVVSSNNRRQGMSIGPSKHVYIVNSTFRDTNGTLPQAGIDIEPQDQGPTSTVRIENCLMTGNKGNGIEMHAHISGIDVVNNNLTANAGFGLLAISAPNLNIVGNHATRNGLSGIGVSGTSHDVTITNNILQYNSTHYMSPTRAGGGTQRDLQVGSKTYRITVQNNKLS